MKLKSWNAYSRCMLKFWQCLVSVSTLQFAGMGMCQGAGNLLENGDGSAHLAGWEGFSAVGDDGGIKYFILPAGEPARSETLIEVDTGKTYLLSGAFRSDFPHDKRIFVGLECFTEDERPIRSANVAYVPDTETTLLEDAYVGDHFIVVKDASSWLQDEFALRNGRVAFNVDPTGDVSDLPNFDLSNRGITKIESLSNGYRIEFDLPLPKNYPAETPVRQHYDFFSFCYPEKQAGLPLQSDWNDFAFRVSGEISLPHGASSEEQVGAFWRGTRYVKVVVSLSGVDENPEHQFQTAEVTDLRFELVE